MSAPTIIDTHQHLWDLARFRLPWLEGVDALNRSHTPADYIEAAAGTGIVRSIYMEVDMADDQRAAEVAYVAECCTDDADPMTAAVVGGRPAEAGFGDWVRMLRETPCVRGVRQVLHVPSTPAGTCRQRAYVHGVRMLGEAGLCFDVCLRPADLADAEVLAAECPDTLLILDHCGNADPHVVAGRAAADGDPPGHDADAWRRHVDALGARSNVVCKISGIAARAGGVDDLPGLLAPTVNHCLDAFGPDRVVVGGDWPVVTLGVTLADWIGALRAIVADRPDDEQRRLFHANAARLYALD